MTTYHVELKGYCDVIVEANSEEEAFDRAVEMIPSSSLAIETAEVKGVLEGHALEMAHRYFPEHLTATKTYQEFPNGSSILVTERCEPSEAGKAGRYHGNQWEQELLKRKVSGEKLDRIEEDFLGQRGSY